MYIILLLFKRHKTETGECDKEDHLIVNLIELTLSKVRKII